jgi:hypothetical protein
MAISLLNDEWPEINPSTPAAPDAIAKGAVTLEKFLGIKHGKLRLSQEIS